MHLILMIRYLVSQDLEEVRVIERVELRKEIHNHKLVRDLSRVSGRRVEKTSTADGASAKTTRSEVDKNDVNNVFRHLVEIKRNVWLYKKIKFFLFLDSIIFCGFKAVSNSLDEIFLNFKINVESNSKMIKNDLRIECCEDEKDLTVEA